MCVCETERDSGSFRFQNKKLDGCRIHPCSDKPIHFGSSTFSVIPALYSLSVEPNCDENVCVSCIQGLVLCMKKNGSWSKVGVDRARALEPLVTQL